MHFTCFYQLGKACVIVHVDDLISRFNLLMDAYGALAQAEYRLEPEKGCYSHIQISS